MIKEFGIKILILFLICFIFLFCSCDNKENEEYNIYKNFDPNHNTEVFFEHINNFEKENIDSINDLNIISLDLYYIGFHSYYNIKYENTKLEEDYHLVFVYNFYTFCRFIPVKSGEDFFKEYFSGEYEQYIESKTNGEHKSFTQEEINSYLDKYRD